MAPIPPAEFWTTHVPQPLEPDWIEDSREASSGLPLSKREILALVLLAYARGGAKDPWLVGFDASTPDPNDGYITSDESRMDVVVESKLVTHLVTEPKDVVQSILDTYSRFVERGAGYGGDRSLVIHANAGNGRLRRLSDLADHIGDDSPFDRIIHMGAIRPDGSIWHLYEAFPGGSDGPGANMAEVHFDLRTGTGKVTHCGILWD